MSGAVRSIGAPTLRAMLLDEDELALLDVREERIFSESHLLFARSVPLSRLELRIARLVPRLTTRIVLVDAGGGLAERAAEVLGEGGYSDLHILDGGLIAWEAAGYELFSGVNVPSKAFGEFVEHESGTPSISAEELNALMQARTDMVVLELAPVRRIFARLDPDRRERARRRTGAARARSRAETGDAGGGQLRRPHTLDHRRAVADQRGRAEQGGGAAQRHDGLESRGLQTGFRPDAPRRRGLAWRARMVESRRRERRAQARHPLDRRGNARGASRRREPHDISVRRARSRRIRRRSCAGRAFGAGRATRAGDGSIRRYAARPHRPGGRQGGARHDDGLVAAPDGLGRGLCAGRRGRGEGRSRGAGAGRSAARRRNEFPPSFPSCWRAARLRCSICR